MLWLSVGDHSAMAPPSGGGEASLKEQKEAGLEQGDTDSSGQEVGLMRLLVPLGEDWQYEGLGPQLTSPMGMDEVGVEQVTIGRRPGRFRKREGRREAGTE